MWLLKFVFSKLKLYRHYIFFCNSYIFFPFSYFLEILFYLHNEIRKKKWARIFLVYFLFDYIFFFVGRMWKNLIFLISNSRYWFEKKNKKLQQNYIDSFFFWIWNIFFYSFTKFKHKKIIWLRQAIDFINLEKNYKNKKKYFHKISTLLMPVNIFFVIFFFGSFYYWNTKTIAI